MNLINAKYGNEPGLKAYTHVSDQFGPFATQTIPASVSEALRARLPEAQPISKSWLAEGYTIRSRDKTSALRASTETVPPR